MIVGDPSKFAIESEIHQFLAPLGQRGLGYFVLHVQGVQFGVKAADATMLACSFGRVGRRLMERGSHRASFVERTEAGEIASAFHKAIYADMPEGDLLLGMRQGQLSVIINGNDLFWAPDGDEAFDDGSFVIQLDNSDCARLIAFRGESPYESVREVRLDPEEFYGVLKTWHANFEAEWTELLHLDAARKSG